MLKFENVKKIEGTKFHNERFELYNVDDSLVKTYFHIKDNQGPFKQTIELRKEAQPVYTLYNQFNKNMMMLDLESVKDVMKFLNKLETIIDTSVTWE
jgi:hypothetical protein